ENNQDVADPLYFMPPRTGPDSGSGPLRTSCLSYKQRARKPWTRPKAHTPEATEVFDSIPAGRASKLVFKLACGLPAQR
ncbi:Hypothetical predicted protein, partial [Marmota monax]